MSEDYTFLTDFINQIDVECPKCGAHALVVSDKNNRSNTRFTCTACGKNSKWEGHASIFQSSGTEMEKTRFMALGKPFDCYFKFNLWYRFDFKQHIFFAYNKEHLAFQKDYIADPLRKRTAGEFGWRNTSLQSRLPKWLLSANNREDLLKKIALIENK